MSEFLAFVFIAVLIILLIRGSLRTFQRSWILALLLFIFLIPVWVCWACVEAFIPSKK